MEKFTPNVDVEFPSLVFCLLLFFTPQLVWNSPRSWWVNQEILYIDALEVDTFWSFVLFF